MINKDRIVPATAQDLLGIYFTAANITQYTNGNALALVSTEEMGVFDGADFASQGMADEPIKEVIIGEATSFTIFGVLDYDFKGITHDGEAIALTNASGHELVGDGCTLYLIGLSAGSVAVLNTMTGEQWIGQDNE